MYLCRCVSLYLSVCLCWCLRREDVVTRFSFLIQAVKWSCSSIIYQNCAVCIRLSVGVCVVGVSINRNRNRPNTPRGNNSDKIKQIEKQMIRQQQ